MTRKISQSKKSNLEDNSTHDIILFKNLGFSEVIALYLVNEFQIIVFCNSLHEIFQLAQKNKYFLLYNTEIFKIKIASQIEKGYVESKAFSTTKSPYF